MFIIIRQDVWFKHILLIELHKSNYKYIIRKMGKKGSALFESRLQGKRQKIQDGHNNEEKKQTWTRRNGDRTEGNNT